MRADGCQCSSGDGAIISGGNPTPARHVNETATIEDGRLDNGQQFREHPNMPFFKNKVSAEEKGERVGTSLPLFAGVAARTLVSQMSHSQDYPYAERELDILVEVVAFYMHVANRLAFRDLGAEPCSLFSRRMMVAVGNSPDLLHAEVVQALRDRYNEREDYYAEFRQFMPEQDQSPDNTLFWEFSKVIFNRFVSTKDMATLILVDRILMPQLSVFIKKTKEELKA